MRHEIVKRKKHRIETKNIPTYFWDFYALNLIYLKSGCLALDREINTAYEDYPNKLSGVRDPYFTRVRKLFPAVMNALDRSCRCEARHAFRGPGRTSEKFHWDNLHEKSPLHNFRKKSAWTVSMNVICRVFNCDNDNVWEDSYGGELWADGAQLYMDLEPQLNKFNVSEWAIAIDRIFDLKHNGGVLLNKTEFALVSDRMLNDRARIKDLSEFWDYADSMSQDVIELLHNYSPNAAMFKKIVAARAKKARLLENKSKKSINKKSLTKI